MNCSRTAPGKRHLPGSSFLIGALLTALVVWVGQRPSSEESQDLAVTPRLGATFVEVQASFLLHELESSSAAAPDACNRINLSVERAQALERQTRGQAVHAKAVALLSTVSSLRPGCKALSQDSSGPLARTRELARELSHRLGFASAALSDRISAAQAVSYPSETKSAAPTRL